MAIQKYVRKEDIVEGDYIPTIGVPNKHWATDGAGAPDWRDNPALVSPSNTKGDLIVYGTQDEKLAVGIDGYTLVADSTSPLGVKWEYPLNPQKEVTTSTYLIIEADDKYTIFFNSPTAITVTVNSLVQENLEVDFYNLGAGAVTFVAGTAALDFPDGSVLIQNKVCALIKFMATNIYKLKGELM
jgi:hypothetical protein